MALFVDVLKDKFTNEEDQNKNQKKKIKVEDIKNNVKKSGLLTGVKSSMTYQNNNLNHLVNHSLNKDKNKKYLSERAMFEIAQMTNLFEDISDSSVTYKRNIQTIGGAKRSAVPHTTMADITAKLTPSKPRDGRVPSTFNTVEGQKLLLRKENMVKKLFNTPAAQQG